MLKNLLRLSLVNRLPLTDAAAVSRRHYSRRFIALPIFYVNGDPHIGHLYTALLGDAAYRWETLKGSSANAPSLSVHASRRIFSAGVDEHGIKVENAARLAGRSPVDHCDAYAQRFQKLFCTFDVSNTHFTRTTDDRHKVAVQTFWSRLADRGFIKRGVYGGWYSAIDECFYREADTERLANGRRVAVETGSAVEYIEEQNYMFDMDRLREDVRQYLLKSEVIHPKHFLTQALQYLKQEGELSISRDAKRSKWGIPVPGDRDQTIYVWFDALVNYLTAAGYPDTDLLWPPDMHIVGKDILKFHAVYWSAFLMAADLPPPRRILVHGHWLVDKVKMSKSAGNVIDPFEMANALTVDGLRYFLLKQGLPHDDCNFALLKAVRTVNADLVNNFGNLVQRSTAKRINPLQLYSGFDVEVMEHELKGTGEKLVGELKSLREKVGNYYESQMYYKGLQLIEEALNHANAFFQHQEPWNLSQGPKLSMILFLAYEACRISGVLLQPIIPGYASRVLARFGLKENERHIDTAQFAGGPSIKIYRRPMGSSDDVGPMLPRINFEHAEHIVYGKKDNV